MRPILYIFILALTLSLSSYQHKIDNDPENEKYLNFITAIENYSTFSYFTVISVKDLNTGKTKEICSRGNLILGAIHKELNLGYDAESYRKALEFAKSKKDRHFEFRNKDALGNISFYKYKVKLVDKIQKDYDFNSIVENIKSDKDFSIRLWGDRMKAFAHVLFNKGFMTGESGCAGGTLYYIDRNSLE